MEILFSLLAPALLENGAPHHNGGEAVEDNADASGFHALLMALTSAPTPSDQAQPPVMDELVAEVHDDTTESDAVFSPKTWGGGMEQVQADPADKAALLMEVVKDVALFRALGTLEGVSSFMVHGHSPPLLSVATSSGDGPAMITTAITEEASALSIAPAAETAQTAWAGAPPELSPAAPALPVVPSAVPEQIEAMNAESMVWSAPACGQPVKQWEPPMDVLAQGANSAVLSVPNPETHDLFLRAVTSAANTNQAGAMNDTPASVDQAFQTGLAVEDGWAPPQPAGEAIIVATSDDVPEDGLPASASLTNARSSPVPPPPAALSKSAEVAAIVEAALLSDEAGEAPVMTLQADDSPSKALFTDARILEAKASSVGTVSADTASTTATGNTTTPPVVTADLSVAASPAQGAPPESVAAQTATPAFIDAPGQTIVREVRVMMDQGVRSLAIRLNPPSLGALRIELVSADGDLELRLSSTTPTTRALLESQGGMLRDALQEQGIRVSRICFADSFADNVEHGHREHSGQYQRQHDAHGSWRADAGYPRGGFASDEFGARDPVMDHHDGCLNIRV